MALRDRWSQTASETQSGFRALQQHFVNMLFDDVVAEARERDPEQRLTVAIEASETDAGLSKLIIASERPSSQKSFVLEAMQEGMHGGMAIEMRYGGDDVKSGLNVIGKYVIDVEQLVSQDRLQKILAVGLEDDIERRLRQLKAHADAEPVRPAMPVVPVYAEALP